MKQQTHQNILLVSLGAPVLLASIGTSMANIALPAISEDFDMTFANARWVVLAYLITTTLLSLVMGQLADRKGRRSILLVGAVLFTAGTFLCGYSPLFGILIFGRIIQGIGAAALITLPIAIVTELMPKEKTGRAIGLLATMSAIGTAAGPSIGGTIVAEHGWRAMFFVMVILGSASLGLLLSFAPSDKASISAIAERPNTFVALKSVWSDPSLRIQLFSNLAVSAVMMSTLITGPFYLTRVLHLDSLQMGMVMSAGPLTSIFSGAFSGYVVDRYGSKTVIKLGFIQLFIGAISFVMLPSLLGVVGFAVSAVLLSLGYQLFLSSNSTDVMKRTSADRRGLVSGALSLSRNMGLIGGASLMGGIFEFFGNSNGLQATFLFAALLIALLLANHLKIQKRRNYATRLVNPLY